MRPVSTSHRLFRATDTSAAVTASATSPAARRVTVARWRDPRLWLGVLLVCGSVVVGAKLLAAADATVAVWQLSDNASAGMPIDSNDLHATRVHFDDESVAAGYWLTSRALPQDAHLSHDVSAGELLSAAAITTGEASSLKRMPLHVTSSGFPVGLDVGDHVEVWAVSGEETAGDPQQVLADVTVMALSADGMAGVGGDRDVAVSLPAGADVGEALRWLNGASVVLILIGA